MILFRGTQFLADWLTNINASVSSSAGKERVHDGFNDAFKNMKPQIGAFLNGIPSGEIKAIHCIGHSLGGAIATLCAEWIVTARKYRPYLYTCGSPKVGLKGFAQQCSTNLGNERIFRVYHKTDVEPFVPSWPYYHTPYDGKDYYLYSLGNMLGVKYHSMDEYVKSVASSANSWKVLGLQSKVKKQRCLDQEMAGGKFHHDHFGQDLRDAQ